MTAERVPELGTVQSRPWCSPQWGDGAVWLIELHAPARRNAMSRAMWLALREQVQTVSQQVGVRAIVLRGAGQHFSAGGDIFEYPQFRFDAARLRAFHEDEVWPALQAIRQCPVPVVACIDGYCMGGGLEIACASDLRLATDRSQFGAPINKLGFPMAPKEMALVASQLGTSVARAVLLAAQVLPAERLLQQGFLLDCVEPEQLVGRLDALLCKLLQAAPNALAQSKLALLALDDDVWAVSAAGSAASYAYAASDEHREGIDAFVHKRKAGFDGTL
ncbi:enoyl-CoA hydratase/isomerase family protein [Curvibacter sp. CHRR-16]|uniref:enoyl-CoA hydratase/isomerase family protein n=1 Tax=Curvibacter sp. CHRR-16 TaxID=2835872 RepID=UPI001BDB64E4|nr:enoyl-CoA hydratase/isomerase family protein [Curvibacter sp. CHRR-16]MBT0570673.1 enoyl-CoA hydratase/isomerase family protein [Curvibacter sp. CHRR-16]